MDFRIVSIGAIDANPFWGESQPVRSGHSTTTLIRSTHEGEQRVILVDPGLPAQVLQARLRERAGIDVGDVTHVFLTCFRPDVRRGLEAFDGAVWWVSERERETVGVPMVEHLKRAESEGEVELAAAIERDVALLRRCEAAPDSLADRVDLFPLPGVTPGMCGLLLEEPRHTTLICGDAVPTAEHLERGQVPVWASNVQQAKDSFAEALEIADLLVPGRDNLVVNPVKRPF